MTSKERVLLALNHEEADRVPLDIGGINNTSMHKLVEAELKQYMGLEDHGFLMRGINVKYGAVQPDQSIVDHFGVDTCSIFVNEPKPLVDKGDGIMIDMWGIKRQLAPNGLYYDIVEHPLDYAETVDDIMNYPFPEPNEYLLDGLAPILEANRDKCCILEGFDEELFGLPAWLRGFQNFYMDLLSDEDLCDALLRRLTDFYKNYFDFVLSRIGDQIDIVKVADDFGTQNSLLLSPRTYRERIKPFAAELYAHIRKYNVKLLLHSCGAIRPLLNDLIEIGVDAINPVQISAAGMVPAELKAEFGDRITFWGGGVDTQGVLAFGTPDEVRKQVKENLTTFKPGGGYVFAQVHNIQPGVPVENIVAMYDAYHEYAAY